MQCRLGRRFFPAAAFLFWLGDVSREITICFCVGYKHVLMDVAPPPAESLKRRCMATGGGGSDSP
jgi:hypothetical protein